MSKERAWNIASTVHGRQAGYLDIRYKKGKEACSSTNQTKIRVGHSSISRETLGVRSCMPTLIINELPMRIRTEVLVRSRNPRIQKEQRAANIRSAATHKRSASSAEFVR